MAKKTKKDQSAIMTIDEWYAAGIDHYKQALDLHKAGGDKGQIDDHWGVAASEFWDAFVFGHPQASYSLSCCFNKGLGVRHDDYVAKLFFGVALELGDEKCERDTNKQTIPPSMKKAVAELTQLVRKTHATFDIHSDVDAAKLLSQAMIFDKAIKLPHLPNLNITKCFLEENYKPAPAAAVQDHAAAHDDYQNMDDVPASGEDSGCCCVLL